MPTYQCQHCGQPLEVGHNCDGKPFAVISTSNSISAIGVRQERLQNKGFHEDSYIDGAFYRHPMYGKIFIYPGGAFCTSRKTDLPLDAYIESLPDSSYTDLREFGFEIPHGARCDACGETGPLFPDEHDQFRHAVTCQQAKFLTMKTRPLLIMPGGNGEGGQLWGHCDSCDVKFAPKDSQKQRNEQVDDMKADFLQHLAKVHGKNRTA
jgi:hypothetical protein